MSTATGASALTPDFYEYDWYPPQSVMVEGRFVRLRWSDGAELKAFDLWLRENAVGTGGVDEATRECLIDPADHDDTLRITTAAIDGDGSVRVRWEPSGRVGCFHPGWLHHVALGSHRADAWLPKPVVWRAADLAEPPSDHWVADAAAQEPLMRRFVDRLLTHGLARLRDVGTAPDFGLQLAARIGPVRDTNFGPIWDVKADIAMAGLADTNSTANTTMRLGPHTDLPTRETPPGFQFLHCIANTTQGGSSTMTDGAAVVEELAEHHPAHYEALTTLRWVFFNRGPGIDHRWSAPLIDHGVQGSPLTLRAFYPVRAFPDMAEHDQPRAYEALAVFSRLAADPAFQISYPFEPGDIVGFDNRRILHGRDAYSAGGTRHLRGFYMDHDEIRSFARVAHRRPANDHREPETINA